MRLPEPESSSTSLIGLLGLIRGPGEESAQLHRLLCRFLWLFELRGLAISVTWCLHVSCNFHGWDEGASVFESD